MWYSRNSGSGIERLGLSGDLSLTHSSHGDVVWSRVVGSSLEGEGRHDSEVGIPAGRAGARELFINAARAFG